MKRFIKNFIIFIVFSLYLIYMVNNYLTYKNNKNLLLNNDLNTTDSINIIDEGKEADESNNTEENINNNGDSIINKNDKVLYSEKTDYDKYLTYGKKWLVNKYMNISTESDIGLIEENLDKSLLLKKDYIDQYKDIINREFDIDNLSFERKISLNYMIDILNNFNDKTYKKNSEIYSIYDYSELLNGIMFYGDSQVGVMRAYNNKLKNYMYSIGGANLKKQYNDIDKILNENLEVVVFFNGYNIANYKDADEYVEDYKLIIKKIHEYNKDIKVFITSLLPARENVVIEDLKSTGAKYNYYNGPTFDKKLKETFNDIEEAVYIDTNWAIIEKFYDSVDGVHFVPEFYWSYMPYVVSYVYFVLAS